MHKSKKIVKLYTFIESYVKEYKWFPSKKEIMIATNINLATINYYLKLLEQENILTRGKNHNQARINPKSEWKVNP